MLKNKELYELMAGINAVSELKGVKFVYAIAKNKAAITKEIEVFQKVIEPSKEFSEYETARIKLAEEHSKKKDGKPVIEGNNYTLENKAEFEIKFEELKEAHKETIDARKKQIEEFNALLEEESDFKPHILKQTDLPEDITSGQLNGIFKVVE